MTQETAALVSLENAGEILRLARHAVETRKLLITWEGERPAALSEAQVLRAVWVLLRRWHPDPPGVSQDERVWLKVIAREEHGYRVHVRAVFDRDFCSQYDQSEELEKENFWEYPTGQI